MVCTVVSRSKIRLRRKTCDHRTLKEWKAEYGSDTVESWLTK
ncbi:hypothetical protein [Pseudomonas fluorescens]